MVLRFKHSPSLTFFGGWRKFHLTEILDAFAEISRPRRRDAPALAWQIE
jgi:hypothetical protein